MDWNTILGDIISGAILLAIGGIGGWFTGIIKREERIFNCKLREKMRYINH